MIVRRLVIHIEQVVIQVADAALCPHAVQTDRLEREIRHNRVDIVRQRLVDIKKNFLSGNHASRYVM